jgi:hypothetical protein
MNLKARTRVVYFRISEEDYGKLNQLCQAQGVRSLSDLARTAVHDMLDQAAGVPTTNTVVTKLETLERMMADLNEALKSMGRTRLKPNERSS